MHAAHGGVSTGLSRGGWIFLGVMSVLAAAAATLAPLATYALTLAAFGLVHVFTELRYVDKRFTPRLPFGLTATWLGILGLIVLLRVVRMTADTPLPYAETGELLLVVALAIGALIPLRKASWGRRLVGVLVVGALLVGALLAPLTTLVILAVLHNLTPIGFLAERFEGSGRRAWLVGALLLFGMVPFLIGNGGTRMAAEMLGWSSTLTGPLGTGSVQEHLGVFVPKSLHPRMLALWWFAAAAYLQCMHYAIVIGILPRYEPKTTTRADTYIRWPAARVWLPLLAVIGLGSFLVYAWSFRDARALYGLFALVHAWVEVPVLLAALAPLPRSA